MPGRFLETAEGLRRRKLGLEEAVRSSHFLAIAALLVGVSCTLHQSRTAVPTQIPVPVPSEDSTFVTEEDSGFSLLGVFVITEPDHYAVLMERMRRRHNCSSLSHVQLDFFTDYWILVGFPIARLTAVCEPVRETPDPEPAAAPVPPPPEPLALPEDVRNPSEVTFDGGTPPMDGGADGSAASDAGLDAGSD